MTTISKQFLSSSTNGRGIKVVQTGSAGTAIHTAHATADDELWLFAYNSDSVSRLLTIEFGGTSAPDDNIKATITSQSGLTMVVPGLILSGGVAVKAFADSANVVVIFGFVNRITN
jgi:hypothetical protein